MFAIIIPFYKLTFFDDTLQSLADQIDKRFKVYIGDDASPEDCSGLLIKYKGQFDFIYHRFESNLGGTSLTQQWERCIALSSDEEWVMILGDDDVLGDNVVEEFYKQFKKVNQSNLNVVRFASQKINSSGIPISEIFTHPELELSTDFLVRKSRSSLSEYVFRANKLKQIKFENLLLGWYSDVLAVLEVSDFSEVFTINQGCVHVRISSESISGNEGNCKMKIKSKFRFYFILNLKYFKRFDKKGKVFLIDELEKCYLNNKKDINPFFKIVGLFLLKFHFKEIIRFNLKIVKNI